MIMTTLEDIINGFVGDENYRIYVFLCGDIPLYVGQSKDAIMRVLSHLGMGQWVGLFGSSFDTKLKTYGGWEKFDIALFTCEEYGKRADDPLFDSYVDTFESSLIYDLSPVFNVMGKKKSNDNSQRWYAVHPEPIVTYELENE